MVVVHWSHDGHVTLTLREEAEEGDYQKEEQRSQKLEKGCLPATELCVEVTQICLIVHNA